MPALGRRRHRKLLLSLIAPRDVLVSIHLSFPAPFGTVMHLVRSFRIHLLLFSVALLTAAPLVVAQLVGGTIAGDVIDPSNATVEYTGASPINVQHLGLSDLTIVPDAAASVQPPHAGKGPTVLTHSVPKIQRRIQSAKSS
jgi:hypothetical protein